MNDILGKIVVEPIESFWDKFLHFLPMMLSAIVIFLVGVLVAIIFRFVFAKVLSLFGVDRFVEKSGTSELMKKGGLKDQASVLIARFFAWIIVVIFAVLSIKALDVDAVRRPLERLLLYLPNVLTAVLVIIFGYLLSNFIGRAALIAAVNAGIRIAGTIGKIVKFIVFALAATMAIEQLGIGSNTATIAFAIVLGGIVFALSLAFGLAGKDLAKTYLEKLIGRKDEEGGEDKISHL